MLWAHQFWTACNIDVCIYVSVFIRCWSINVDLFISGSVFGRVEVVISVLFKYVKLKRDCVLMFRWVGHVGSVISLACKQGLISTCYDNVTATLCENKLLLGFTCVQTGWLSYNILWSYHGHGNHHCAAIFGNIVRTISQVRTPRAQLAFEHTLIENPPTQYMTTRWRRIRRHTTVILRTRRAQTRSSENWKHIWPQNYIFINCKNWNVHHSKTITGIQYETII